MTTNFKTWISEVARKVFFSAFYKDGTVIVYIDGVRSVYLTDAVYHDRWKRIAVKNPEKVLGELQYLVNSGKATQEPLAPVDPVTHR